MKDKNFNVFFLEYPVPLNRCQSSNDECMY